MDKAACLLLLLPILAILACCPVPSSGAGEASRQTTGDPECPVKVTRDGSTWLASENGRRFLLSETDLSVRVEIDGVEWRMEPSAKEEVRIRLGESEKSFSLLDARNIAFSAWRTGYSGGVRIELSGFPADGIPADTGLILRIEMEAGSGDILFHATPHGSRERIASLLWPKGMERPASPKGCATVVPAMQGMLLPADWPKEVRLFGSLTQTRALYMPWWGETRGETGYIGILETPYDGGLAFSHPAGGPTRSAPRWVASGGGLHTTRTARYSFLKPATYVTLAKRYRRHVRESGRFVSLREKIARTPAVQRLIGAPVLHEGIWAHVEPESSYYKKDDPAANDMRYNTFDGLAEKLTRLRDRGVSRAYLHVDGWGRRGYDNQHPDPLPPPVTSGGWDGMKRLSETCRRIGFVFALHDQYRDFYLDAPSFSESQALMRPDGTRQADSTWYGGRQMFLCASLAKGYVARNYRLLREHGVDVQGAYLDVFAIADLDECAHPDHPMTRAECARYRTEAFDWIRSKGMVISSEEPVDFAVSHLDLVHHGPYATSPNLGGGEATGIPVPLFSLVYHDSILLPWETGDDGGWGVPKGDAGWLHALLNGGLPYLSVGADEPAIERAKSICEWNERVAQLEMTDHEFLDSSRRRQRVTYADGSSIEVDFDARTYRIRKP